MLLTFLQVVEFFQTDSESTLWLLSNGKIPHPEFIGNRLVRWSEPLLREWVAAGCPANHRKLSAERFAAYRTAISEEQMGKILNKSTRRRGSKKTT